MARGTHHPIKELSRGYWPGDHRKVPSGWSLGGGKEEKRGKFCLVPSPEACAL